MRILYLALLILIFNTPVAFGAGCADATNQTSCNALAGCEFINNTCTPCQNGYYKGQNSDLCEPCPDGYDNTKITNGVGATKMGQCYKFCTRTEQDGTIKTPVSTTEYYPNACAYTISCVTGNDLCNSYALDDPSDNKCYPVWTEDTNCPQGNKSTGIEIYHATDDITISYCTNKTQCNPGYHFEENNKYYCSIAKLGHCVSNKQLCAKLAVACDGTISGEATWDTDINGYDLSTCACTITSEANHGTLQTTCFHGKTVNEWTNCTKKMIKCNAGYWADTNNQAPDDCDAVGRGYYSPANITSRSKCPAGSTTSTDTASLISSCYMTGGITKICDKNDKCITIPVEAGNISYKKLQL